MDTPAALIHVENMLQLLKSPIIYSGIESLLDDSSELVTVKKKTIPMVKFVLQKAEKQEMLQPDDDDDWCMLQIPLHELTGAVFEAHNLFDEITTLVQRNKLMMDDNTERKTQGKLVLRLNRAYKAFIKSCQKIRWILDEIKTDHYEFWSMKMVKSEVRKENPRETGSFVSEKEDGIIGRDTDVGIVLRMLLDTAEEEAVSVISIVGIGGLGKTTLAQLVYKHQEIIDAKFQLRMWVCVSEDFNVKVVLGQILAAATNQATNSSLDLDQLQTQLGEKLNVKVVLGQILAAATNQATNSSLDLDQLQTQLGEKLNGKKFLLVLDDVWNHDDAKWHQVRRLLKQGARGSRVVVTTRSEKVASVVESHHRTTHKLEGLSDENSWKLFERMALDKPEQDHLEEPFIEIGKKIVQQCAKVPLAIRVTGRLVKGYSKETWRQQLKNIESLASMKQCEDNIFNVLKISYHHLPTHLKCCFAYCAVYPKDYKINKEQLIQLWMAQGYILPSDEQSFEVLGEEYFKELLQRCFFHDVIKDDEEDEVISFKMHDLIHDLAKKVAGPAIKSGPRDHPNSLVYETHYYSSFFMKYDNYYSTNMKSSGKRSPFSSSDWSKMKYLRVLDLHQCPLRVLSSQIGELLHLRYLDLSDCISLYKIPDSITQLHNLKTLKLKECMNLMGLPRNLSKLVNLRHLDIEYCNQLTHMPRGMNNMTSLHKLTMFVVSGEGLIDIEDLNHLKGQMTIKIQRGWTSCDATKVGQRRCLINKENVRDVRINWNRKCEEGNNAEAWLEGLQPHSNLRKFELENYPGASFPNWVASSMNLNTSLPNLVQLHLFDCVELLDHLPLVSQLCHLKVLKIQSLKKLEYMESGSGSRDDKATTHQSGGSRPEDELVFFPSLEELTLDGMDELKGWWKTPSHSDLKQTFPRLSKLEISYCPKLISFPFCPKLKTLELWNLNREIGPIIMREEAVMEDGMNNNGDSPTSASTSTLSNRVTTSQAELLRDVRVDDVGFLNCLPKEAFHHLSSLRIWIDRKIERVTTGEMGELFQSGRLSSLRELEFMECSKLKSISGRGVWEHFTALEELTLRSLEEMEMEEEEEKDVNNGGNEVDVVVYYVPWKCLARTLRKLHIGKLPKVVRLPKGMQHLTALQQLIISGCHNLEELPVWIGCLSSLQTLQIISCQRIKSLPEEIRHLNCLTNLTLRRCSRELKDRCQQPNGADWSKIQHILDIYVSEYLCHTGEASGGCL